MRQFLLAAIVLATAASATAQEIWWNPGVIDEVRHRGLLKVGAGHFEPWVMCDVGGDLIGYEVDVANKLAQDLGVRIQFVRTDWYFIVPALIERQFDIVVSGMSITPGARSAGQLLQALLGVRHDHRRQCRPHGGLRAQPLRSCRRNTRRAPWQHHRGAGQTRVPAGLATGARQRRRNPRGGCWAAGPRTPAAVDQVTAARWIHEHPSVLRQAFAAVFDRLPQAIAFTQGRCRWPELLRQLGHAPPRERLARRTVALLVRDAGVGSARGGRPGRVRGNLRRDSRAAPRGPRTDGSSLARHLRTPLPLRTPAAAERLVLRGHEVLEAERPAVHRAMLLQAVEARVREQARARRSSIVSRKGDMRMPPSLSASNTSNRRAPVPFSQGVHCTCAPSRPRPGAPVHANCAQYDIIERDRASRSGTSSSSTKASRSRKWRLPNTKGISSACAAPTRRARSRVATARIASQSNR